MMFRDYEEQYRTDGYFVIDRALTSEQLNLLQQTCSTAITQMDQEFDAAGKDTLGINHRGKRYFVGQSYRSFPELGQVLFSELMSKICRVTIGSTAFLHNDQFVVKCKTTSMSFAWHQDGAYVRARIGDHPECITCWCALDDVNESNGTIYILPASRYGRREPVEHHTDPQTNDRIGYFGVDPGDPIVAKAGSIVVFSNLVFHRSGPNPSGRMRRAYLAQYAPVALQNSPGAMPQYLAEPFLIDGQSIRYD